MFKSIHPTTNQPYIQLHTASGWKRLCVGISFSVKYNNNNKLPMWYIFCHYRSNINQPNQCLNSSDWHFREGVKSNLIADQQFFVFYYFFLLNSSDYQLLTYVWDASTWPIIVTQRIRWTALLYMYKCTYMSKWTMHIKNPRMKKSAFNRWNKKTHTNICSYHDMTAFYVLYGFIIRIFGWKQRMSIHFNI